MENTSIINNTQIAGANLKNVKNTQTRNFTGTNDLDKDAFLKLLVTELRHQDPTQPMENKEFISQMAQFSALEQMTNVNKSIKILSKSSRSGEAYSLLGKDIKAFDPLTGKKIEGIVKGIFYKGDDIRLVVNGREIGLDDINAVYTSDNQVSGEAVKSRPEEPGKNNNININTSKDIKNNNDTNIAEN